MIHDIGMWSSQLDPFEIREPDRSVASVFPGYGITAGVCALDEFEDGGSRIVALLAEIQADDIGTALSDPSSCYTPGPQFRVERLSVITEALTDLRLVKQRSCVLHEFTEVFLTEVGFAAPALKFEKLFRVTRTVERGRFDAQPRLGSIHPLVVKRSHACRRGCS